MADSKLRLQIVTALDDAGLKATKQQIDSMEKSLTKLNNSSGGTGLSRLEKQLGSIQGPLGKLAPIFEGIGGAVAKFGVMSTAVIGAFKTGWDIGAWLWEKAIQPITGLGNKMNELKKQNQKAAKSADKLATSLESAAEASSYAFESSKQKLQDEITAIDQASKAWQNAARQKIAYMTAGQDAESQLLEWQRFQDVSTMQMYGDEEGAQQVEKIYDILKAQLDVKQKLMKFDAETLVVEKSINDQWEKREKIGEKQIAAYDNMRRKEKELAEWESDATWEKMAASNGGVQKYNRGLRIRQRAYDKAKQEYERVNNEYNNFTVDNGELETRALQRQVMASQGQLDVGKAAFAYDQSIASSGNVVGLEFTKEFAAELNASQKESADAIERAVEAGIVEGMEKIFQMK